MKRPFATCLLFAAALPPATQAIAQAERALPRVCTDAYGGSTGFGTPASSFRAQYWYAGQNLPNPWPIVDLGIRLRAGASAVAQSRMIEIVVDNSAVSFAGMSPTFASNVSGGATTFFANRLVNFPTVVPSMDPNVAAAWFPGDQVFVFTGPHLLVDFRGENNGGAGNVLNDGLLTQAPTSVSSHLAGSASCGGTLTASYVGNAVQLVASGLVPGTTATFHIGVENVFDSGLSLPLDLGIVGIPGCHIATLPFATAQSTVSAIGRATLSLPIAINPVDTLMFSAQALHYLVPNPTALTDIATTNAVHNAVGYAGLCNTTYAPSSTAVAATQGPNPINSAIVMLVR